MSGTSGIAAISAKGPEDVKIVDYHWAEAGWMNEGQMAARDYSKTQSPLPHPGEHLREDYLPDYGLTAGSLAKAMGLRDRTRIERLVREAQPVSPDTALRLARVFGTSADFWMNLQAQHDLSAAAIKAKRALKAIKPLEAA